MPDLVFPLAIQSVRCVGDIAKESMHDFLLQPRPRVE